MEKQRRLNSLLSINRIPPEILSEIFMYWMTDSRSILYYHRPGTRSLWIQIAQVCHHWREVALSSPRLWGDFTMGQADFTPEILLRSKQVPLKIKVSRTDARSLTALGLVLRELPRIQTLEFDAFDLENVSSLMPRSSSTPLLHTLVFISSRTDVHTTLQKERTLFDRLEIPHLSNLKLINTHTGWSSRIFKSTLTHLTFAHHAPHAYRPYSNSDFTSVLRVLESMQSLQSLDLSGVLPTPLQDETLPRFDFHVSLPALRRLNISDNPHACAVFLRHINIFTATSLNIYCTSGSRGGVQQLFSVLASKLRGSGPSGAIRPILSAACSNLSIKGYDTFLPVSQLFTLECAPPLEPFFMLQLPHGFSLLFAEFCRVLPLHDVQAFLFLLPAESHAVGAELFRKACVSMPNMRELRVMEFDSGLTDALEAQMPIVGSSDQNVKETQGDSKIVLPDLKVLHLSRVWFRRHIDTPFEENNLPKYRKMLSTRNAAGRELERFVLSDCINMDQEDVDSFNGIVKHIEWDGDECWSEEDDGDEDEFGL